MARAVRYLIYQRKDPEFANHYRQRFKVIKFNRALEKVIN